MLQSPSYTTARPPTGVTSGLAGRLSKFLRGGGEGAPRTVNKENAPSNHTQRPVNGRDLTSALKSDPDISVTKELSLASSVDQIYDKRIHDNEAGKPYTATSYHDVDNWSPSRLEQVHGGRPPSGPCTIAPLTSQTLDKPSNYDATAARYTPIGFGLDGGADSQPLHENFKAAQKSHPDFDYKGVTHADYEVKREDHNNAWHKGEVEDFFRELAANERKEIQSYQQSSPKQAS